MARKEKELISISVQTLLLKIAKKQQQRILT